MNYLEPKYRRLMVCSPEEAMEYIKWYEKRDIEEVLIDYITVGHYDYALNAIVRKNETEYPVLFRGSRFKKELLVEGALIDFGVDLISTSLDEKIASRFAASDYLPEHIYEECAEFEIVDTNDINFNAKVNALYGNVLFEIHNAKGLYLNLFFDEVHNFTKEKEVLIENRYDTKFKIVSIEPYTFEVDDSEYLLTKVVVHPI